MIWSLHVRDYVRSSYRGFIWFLQGVRLHQNINSVDNVCHVIFDGNSEHSAHVYKSGISISWRHLYTWKVWSNPMFFRKGPILLNTCATCSELPSYTSTMMYVFQNNSPRPGKKNSWKIYIYSYMIFRRSFLPEHHLPHRLPVQAAQIHIHHQNLPSQHKQVHHESCIKVYVYRQMK